MGKTVGYIVALVAIGLIIYFVATSGKKAAGPAGPAGPAGGAVEQAGMTYSAMADRVKSVQASMAEAQSRAPAGTRIPPLNLSFLNAMTLEDKGKVLSVQAAAPASIMVDVDGDGQPDVDLTWGPMTAAPPDVTQGAQISFTAKPAGGSMQGDHLVIKAEAQKYTMGGM
jgi:hypothetical protein